MAGKRGPYRKRPVVLRLLDRIEKDEVSGCWLWTGSVKTNGYAQIEVGGSTRQAHRVAYEEFVGPIPDGLDIDHQCHNQDESCGGGPSCRHRRCINPDHLEPATRSANLSRGRLVGNTDPVLAQVQRAKTHCPAGHPYDDENTRVYQGRRYCKTCHRERTRARRERDR